MKKLFYPALAVLALSACDNADKDTVAPSPIQHKTINASFAYTSPLQVDVNNDGTLDFAFSNVLVHDAQGAHNLFYIRALENNRVLLNMQNEIAIGNWAATAQADAMLQENSSGKVQWERNTGFVLDIRQPSNNQTLYDGPLAANGEVYVGIKLKENGVYKTGWVKLAYVPQSSEVQVKEVAYTVAASDKIKAGQR